MKRLKRMVSKFVCFIFTVLTVVSPFTGMINVNAETLIGIVTANVNVRTIPGTGYSSSILGFLTSGTSITILDTVPTSDGSTGCPGLWYKLSYNGGTGYSCSRNFDTTNEYSRPWTTPKKAIVGGAKFKAKNYIAKGQYTSYLVKFNVNPNSSSSVYTHQYMTNVRAPWSEAQTSYSAYLENGLLEKPLVFTIPIFDNMPEGYTTLPGAIADANGQSEVTDTTFEAVLDVQQFPESYKKKLRALHSAYPKWVFESLKTGLDWNESVSAEQPVSYIDGSNTLLRELNASGGYILKESSNWYLANTQTTAYFLDPRNFLTDKFILMFEKLAYSPVYTEAIIQGLLDSTFMAGMSASDNQTYASIFVEAGLTANTSAIYLASLAIQECGTNGSMATSGSQFTYNGITYAGLYNFFNIGASSSEASPVKAGLVWANGGSVITVVSDNTPTITTENTYLNNLGLTKVLEYVTGIDINRTVVSIRNQLTTATLTVSNSSGSTLSSDDKIGTGSKIVISDGTNIYTNTVVIYGDINGDSSVNAVDLLYMRKYLLNTYNLDGANLQAAKIAKGSSVGAADLLYLRKYLLDSNTYKITQ